MPTSLLLQPTHSPLKLAFQVRSKALVLRLQHSSSSVRVSPLKQPLKLLTSRNIRNTLPVAKSINTRPPAIRPHPTRPKPTKCKARHEHMSHRIIDRHAPTAGMITNVRRFVHIFSEDVERERGGFDFSDHVRDGGDVGEFEDRENGAEDLFLKDCVRRRQVGDQRWFDEEAILVGVPS
jgi:hypothetical protein